MTLGRYPSKDAGEEGWWSPAHLKDPSGVRSMQQETEEVGGEGNQQEEPKAESAGSHAPPWPPPSPFRPLQVGARDHASQLRGPYLPAQPGRPARPRCLGSCPHLACSSTPGKAKQAGHSLSPFRGAWGPSQLVCFPGEIRQPGQWNQPHLATC